MTNTGAWADWQCCVCISKIIYAPLFRRKLFLYLFNDGLVAGIPLRLTCFTPIPHKLFNGGLQLVHVERWRWSSSPHVILPMGGKKNVQDSKNKPHACLEHPVKNNKKTLKAVLSICLLKSLSSPFVTEILSDPIHLHPRHTLCSQTCACSSGQWPAGPHGCTPYSAGSRPVYPGSRRGAADGGEEDWGTAARTSSAAPQYGSWFKERPKDGKVTRQRVQGLLL